MADLIGFRIRNQSQILQVDGEYQNHELYSKTDYLIGTNAPDGDMWGPYVDIPYPAGRVRAFVAVRTSAPAGVYVVRLPNGNFRVYRGNQNPITQNVPFTAYVFAAPIERPNTGGIGIVVRSLTTGAVVFNSNFKYLRILNFAPVNLTMPQDANAPVPNATFAYPGKMVAIVQCVRPNGRRAQPGGPPQQPIGIYGFFGGTMRTPDTITAVVEHRVIASHVGPPATLVAQQNVGTYMIIDVTGF